MVEDVRGVSLLPLAPWRRQSPGIPSSHVRELVNVATSRFVETNVRTYVRDEDGRPGIWFFSLDATGVAAVATARLTYRLPYCWSRMSLEHDGDVVRYDCRRRWPGPAKSHVVVRVGEPYAPSELGPLEHFLTARWILFSRARRYHRLARAAHAPWVIHRATALEVDDGLIAAAGLPDPVGPPLVHYSPGVQVRIGRPEQPAAPTSESAQA